VPANRVVIADSDLNFRRKIKDILRHMGYMVIGEAGDGKNALQVIFQVEPEIVILEEKIPGSEGIDIAEIVGEHQVAPVVLTVEINPRGVEELARKTGVYGILTKPLQETNILPVLETALANFERVTRLQKEASDLRRQLETRKLVEQAKGLLIEKEGISEQEAYKYLQKISMDKCLPMAKVARQVIFSLKNGHKKN
jgi:response regulator NasT